MDIIKKDSKNRVTIGSESPAKYFTKEIDEAGRIILTPQMDLSLSSDEGTIILSNADRDRFVEALLSKPVRNEAFLKAQAEFEKKFKKE